MKCPKCSNGNLVPFTLKRSGLVLDQCHRCAGMWFDKAELHTVLRKPKDKLLEIPVYAYKNSHQLCPRCITPLGEFSYPATSVSVDGCDKCEGVWLDHDEWKAIAAAS